MMVPTGRCAVDKEELRAVVAGALDIEVDEVSDQVRIIADLGLDSLMALEIMVRVEKRYGFRPDGHELQEATTFQAAYELLVRRLEAAS